MPLIPNSYRGFFDRLMDYTQGLKQEPHNETNGAFVIPEEAIASFSHPEGQKKHSFNMTSLSSPNYIPHAHGFITVFGVLTRSHTSTKLKFQHEKLP